MNYDVMIIGGGFAGHAAAMQLGRARRHVLLLDAEMPRNRFASASHGFLGQDGVAPAEIIRQFKQQLLPYKTVQQMQGEAVSASKTATGFKIRTATDESFHSRRIILASGIKDRLPDVSGLAQRWGVSVLHCPYCHGYELNKAPIGVLGDSQKAFHQAMLVKDWGATTLFTQGTLELTDQQRASLRERGVELEETPIVELMGEGCSLEAVRLADDRLCIIAALYVAPKIEVVGNLAQDLGCAFEDSPFGHFIMTDSQQQSSMPGVFAAGDAAAAMSNATLAAAAGVKAGAGAHFSLVFT